jgi:hypothetical protein
VPDLGASTIQVRYALSPETRKAFARALGSLDLAALPSLPRFPAVDYVPQQGDRLRWEEVPEAGVFVVAHRVITFGANGALSIDLMVETEAEQSTAPV